MPPPTLPPPPGEKRRQARRDRLPLVLRLSGAGLLVATGAVHLDLYLTGYRTIPTIGGLFLFQLIVAFGLGLAVLVPGNRLVAGAGAGFAAATLGGYLLSLRTSLFGFREVRTTAGIVAGVIEVVTFAVLAAFVLSPLTPLQPPGATNSYGTRLADRAQAAVPPARWAAGALSVLAAVLLGVSLGITGPAPTSAGAATALLKTARAHGVLVLTDAHGYTLYWFAPDTPAKSACYGTCAVYWPPITGNPVAGPGVTGKLGSIKRSDGTTQVTYDRHPLYSYVGDSAPGQANGNAIDLNGGFWYEMAVPGSG
jgi:predicted lipoprotein with Yx(FWY)xxD motif